MSEVTDSYTYRFFKWVGKHWKAFGIEYDRIVEENDGKNKD